MRRLGSIAVGTALALVLLPAFAWAMNEGISVSGNSRIYFEPDFVEISFTASTSDPDILKAKEDNEALVEKVLAFCKKEKLTEKNIQIEQTRLARSSASYHKTVKYTANTAITIHLHEISKYKQFQIQLVKLGIKEIRSVTFLSTKMKELYDKAIRQAVQDAKAKAELIAKELDVEVGKPKSVRAQEGYYGGEKKVYRYTKTDVFGDDAENFKPTSIYVEAVINVVFTIK